MSLLLDGLLNILIPLMVFQLFHSYGWSIACPCSTPNFNRAFRVAHISSHCFGTYHPWSGHYTSPDTGQTSLAWLFQWQFFSTSLLKFLVNQRPWSVSGKVKPSLLIQENCLDVIIANLEMAMCTETYTLGSLWNIMWNLYNHEKTGLLIISLVWIKK